MTGFKKVGNCRCGASNMVCSVTSCEEVQAGQRHRAACSDASCPVCVAAVMETPAQRPSFPSMTSMVLVEAPLKAPSSPVQGAFVDLCPCGRTREVCNTVTCSPIFGVEVSFSGKKREAFPSLSLMSNPITPAKPRIKPFPGYSSNFGLKYRCRVELHDINRTRGCRPEWQGPRMSDYAAPAAEGWGDTPERAYNAWKSKWRAMFEKELPR